MARRRHGLVLMVRVFGSYSLSACSWWTMIMHRTLTSETRVVTRALQSWTFGDSPYIFGP